MSNNGFTPIQYRMLQVLSDGRRHRKVELHACIEDELAPINAIHNHVCALRKKLQARGEDIICEFFSRAIFYRHVRLLPSANDGRS